MFKRLLAAVAVCLLAFAPAAAFAAAGVAADLTVNLRGSYTGSNDLGTPTFFLNAKTLNRLTAGTTAQKADKLFSDTRTLAASATENLDLAGVLTDPFGAALSFAKVKGIYVKAAVGNTNSVCVGGHGSAAFLGPFSDATDVVCIPPGGALFISAPAAGWTVTATTADLIKVTNSGGTTGVTYDVVIVGTSA